MTKRGIITIVVMILLANLTPAGLYVYIAPLIIGFIGGKEVWKFYLRILFGDDK